MTLFKRTTINVEKNILKFWWGLKKIQFGFLGGTNIRIMSSSFFGHSNNVYIDNNVFIGANAYLDAISSIYIKEGSMIGPNCTMIAGNHNYRSADLRSVPYDNRMLDTPIIVEKNVWIGADVTICPGSYIGEGAVIGAGCCIHGTIPKYSIVVPSDFRIVGYRNADQYEALAEQKKIYNCIYAGRGFEIVNREQIYGEEK